MKKIPQLDDPTPDAPSGDAPEAVAFDGTSSGTAASGSDVNEPLATHGSGKPVGAAAGDTGSAAKGERSDKQSGLDSNRKSTQASKRGRKGATASRSQARRFARERTLQALYQWDMSDADSSSVRREFVERQDMSRVDVAYFERLFKGITHDVEPVDAALGVALDRPLGEVDPIERAVLRIAAFELANMLETPARVIINEGVEITKRFGADNGHRYVNGVLDQLAVCLRPLEMKKR